MSWMPIERLNNSDKIPKGVTFKLLPTKEGIAARNYIPENGLDYILIDLPEDYMCLSCLSEGEEGNTMSYLKKHKDGYVTGKEVKRMLLDNVQKVLINLSPKYVIVDKT